MNDHDVKTLGDQEPPFAIRCEGKQVADWTSTLQADGSLRFASADGGLELVWSRTPRGVGWEFEARLTNTGGKPSGLLSGIEFFRMRWPVALESIPVVHHSGGGLTDAVFPSPAWRIKRTELPDWSALKLEGDKGRSSNKDLPLFLVSDEDDAGGFAFAVGYSGNVVSTILRDVDYRSVLVSCSVRDLQLRLPPGETVRLGSVLVVPYEGDSIAGKNALRRVLREEICPPLRNPARLPGVAYQHWFGIEAKFTGDSLLKEADVLAGYGAEYFEIDAAVFEQGTFPHYGAGNWGRADLRKFPQGVEAFADAVRGKGLRFGLWIEPETVEAGTFIAREHPEWVIQRPPPNHARFLFDFSIPAAAEYMTDLIVEVFSRYGVEWSRVDSNLDPDKYWASIADPGERGYRELKHFEHFHRFLDQLLARLPNLHIEGCSSGGRRIDLEILKRSHCLWISDNTAYPSTVHQHIGGANHFLPAHLLDVNVVKYPLFEKHIKAYAECGEEWFTDFWMLSLFGGYYGLGGPHSAYSPAIQAKFKRHIAKYKELRQNLMGDFYPLLPQPACSADWDAWQFHNPATGCGHAIVFKMRGSANTRRLPLRALEGAKAYRVASFPDGGEFDVSGADLTARGIEVRLDGHYSARLFAYAPHEKS